MAEYISNITFPDGETRYIKDSKAIEYDNNFNLLDKTDSLEGVYTITTDSDISAKLDTYEDVECFHYTIPTSSDSCSIIFQSNYTTKRSLPQGQRLTYSISVNKDKCTINDTSTNLVRFTATATTGASEESKSTWVSDASTGWYRVIGGLDLSQSYDNVSLQIDINNLKGDFYFCSPRVEYGSTATEWTPSEADVLPVLSNKIFTHDTAINQNTAKITNNTTNISTNKTNISTINTNLSNGNFTITENTQFNINGTKFTLTIK